MPAKITSLSIYRETLSKALERMANSDDIQEVFREVLSDIREYYQAGRVSIITARADEPNFHTCLFEIDDEGVGTCMECIDGFLKNNPSWLERLKSEDSIIVDDTHKLDSKEYLTKQLFLQLGVRAHIAVPIKEEPPQMSFLCVDILDRPYHWTADDESMLKDVANLIMMWRKLQASNKKAKKEKEYIQNILDHIPVGVALYDKQGKIRYANKSVLKVFFTDSIEHIDEFNLFESRILTEKEKEQIRRKENFSTFFEYTYGSKPTQKSSPTGKALNLKANYSKLYDNDGNLLAYLGTYIDKTRENSISEKIKELDGYMSVCAEFAKIGFSRVNVMDGTGYGTRQWFRNANIEPDSNREDYAKTVSRLHPDDMRDVLTFRSVVMYDPTMTLNRRLRVKKDDGSGKYDYLQTYSVVTKYEPQNGIVEICSISHNINRQVNMEQMLIEARNEAEKTDKLKTAFLANMSHEIRTPLNAIVGFSQLLCSDAVPEEEKSEVAEIIENNNSLLLQLISDILDLAKLEAGTLEFKMKETDVNSICRTVASAVEMKMKPEVKMIISCPETECRITTDPNRLKQVMLNFATNAAKFTNDGHIRLGYTRVDKAHIRLFVEDTGIGIEKEKISQVFKRFVKLNRFKPGNGLGLQISREIVAKLGGQIGADSELSKGSTFWCILPTGGVEK